MSTAQSPAGKPRPVIVGNDNVAGSERHTGNRPAQADFGNIHRGDPAVGDAHPKARWPGAAAAVLVVLIVGICGSALLQAAKVKVQTQAVPKFGFREIKTWAGTADGAGVFDMARSSKAGPAPMKKLVDPIIVSTVGRELSQR